MSHFIEKDHQSIYEELRNKTVPELLLHRATKTPNDVAYLFKKRGIYNRRTWSELLELVSACAMGFMEMGLTKGKRVAIIGDPSEEYVISELASQSIGAITYGIYPTSSQMEIGYLLKDGGAYMLICGNYEYVDRALPLFNSLEDLKYLVVIDMKGMFAYDKSIIIPFEEVMKEGRKLISLRSFNFYELIRLIRPTDALAIIYTSGTTGNPKGAVISHGKHLAASYTFIGKYPVLAKDFQRTVIFLPLCHIVGRVTAITLPLLTNIIPHYGEDIEDFEQTIIETEPTVLFIVPRYLQKFTSRILVGIQGTTHLKRLFYRISIFLGKKYITRLWERRMNPFFSIMYYISRIIMFRPILKKLGFDKLKLLLSVGAPLSPEIAVLWQIYGVNISDVYGQTETGGAPIATQGPYFPRPGDVGLPPFGWEVRIDKNGEILVKGKDIFEGYWNNEKGTAEVLDKESWLHTGDIGEWTPEGHLKILDRLKDIIVTSGGKTLSPTFIENALRKSPYINEAVVFGHNRNYVTALIEINFDTVSAWARMNGISYTGFNDLCKNQRIVEFINGEIKKANNDLARVEQVKHFKIIPQELDPWYDGEPITPTRKVKRELMYKKFKDLIESMYTDKEEQEQLAKEVGDVLR